MTGQSYEGGCLCRAIRYSARGTPHKPHYCHCRICQRGVGAPLTAWVNFPLADFAWVAGEPTWYRSSPELRRGFCATCGASLCTLAEDDSYVCVTLASLDEPGKIAPALHMWTGSQAPWLEIHDELPRYEGQA